MGEPPRHPASEEDTGVVAEHGSAGGTPRRLSLLRGVLAIAIAIGLVVLIVILHLTGTLGPGAH